MPESKKSWRIGKRDSIFLLVVAVVVLALSFGSQERRTAATPDDAVHIQADSRSSCLTCHGSEGVWPQPAGHTKAYQCFQCHIQPKEWVGNKP